MAILVALVAALFILSVAGQVSRFYFDHPDVFGLVDLFYLDNENNVPTWFQSENFLACAALLIAIGMAVRSSGGRFATHWMLLGVVFAFLSLDEMASIHERTIEPLQRLFKPTGIWAPTWVVLAVPVVAVLAILYLRFFFHLRRGEQAKVALAALIYLGGAVGVEMATAELFDTANPSYKDSFSYSMAANIEELLEMAGQLIFIDFLLRRASRTTGISIAIIDHGKT